MKYPNQKTPSVEKSKRRRSSVAVRWMLMLMLATGVWTDYASAQGEQPATSVPSVSIAPTLFPNVASITPSVPPALETLVPSPRPAPTEPPQPTNTPTTSSQPSPAPTSSPMPTISIGPSTVPTLTHMPTDSAKPSSSPTASVAPTNPQTDSPSNAPSTEPPILTEETFNNRMIFDGLPFLLNYTNVTFTNTTANRTWTNITSEHVITYWQERNYTDFSITSVVTNIINQFPEPVDFITNISRTRVIYDQQVKYTSTGPNTPVQENQTVLGVYPFQLNSQPYSDRLWRTFATSDRIIMLEMSLSSLPPASSPPTLPPNVQPTPESNNNKADASVVVAAVLGSIAAVGLVSFIIVWNITRRKPDIILDEDFVVHESSHGNETDLVSPSSEDPRVFRPVQNQDKGKEDISAYSGLQISENSLPETDPFTENDDDARPASYQRDNSLHVGIPVEGDVDRDSLEDDSDESDDSSYYYPQNEAYRESVIEAHRPSLTGFALKIQELEE